jgi:hypothetical protein
VVRIHSPRPILSIVYNHRTRKQPFHLPFQSAFAQRMEEYVYCGHGGRSYCRFRFGITAFQE